MVNTADTATRGSGTPDVCNRRDHAMKKVKLIRVLQCSLAAVGLWQAQALALTCGSETPGQCESWNDGCDEHPSCINGLQTGKPQKACCTPTSGQCCMYENTYYLCSGHGSCTTWVIHSHTGGPNKGKCQNSTCQ